MNDKGPFSTLQLAAAFVGLLGLLVLTGCNKVENSAVNANDFEPALNMETETAIPMAKPYGDEQFDENSAGAVSAENIGE